MSNKDNWVLQDRNKDNRRSRKVTHFPFHSPLALFWIMLCNFHIMCFLFHFEFFLERIMSWPVCILLLSIMCFVSFWILILTMLSSLLNITCSIFVPLYFQYFIFQFRSVGVYMVKRTIFVLRLVKLACYLVE